MIDWQWIGWTGNVCFFSRFLVQWLASEKAGRSVAPRAFWWLSLVGTMALGAYVTVKGEPVLLLGLVANGSIYVRNLLLGRRWRFRLGVAGRIAFGLAVASLLAAAAWIAAARLPSGRDGRWLAVAGIGQVAWSTRFFVQWTASEARGHSHFPRSFWIISLVGNALLLSYAIHLQDAVLIAGYLPGPLVQVRNLVLGRRRGAGGGAPEGRPDSNAAPAESVAQSLSGG